LESRWSSGKSSRLWRKLRLGLIAVAVFRSGVRNYHSADELDQWSNVASSHLGMFWVLYLLHIDNVSFYFRGLQVPTFI